jgi:hypothetical protein
MDDLKATVEKEDRGKKSKHLWEAYQIAAENNDLDHFKNMLIQHEQARLDDLKAKQEKEAKKNAKKEKSKRKSTADADVEMEDADGGDDKAKKVTKKRKKDAESEGEGKVRIFCCRMRHSQSSLTSCRLRRLPRLRSRSTDLSLPLKQALRKIRSLPRSKKHLNPNRSLRRFRPLLVSLMSRRMVDLSNVCAPPLYRSTMAPEI